MISKLKGFAEQFKKGSQKMVLEKEAKASLRRLKAATPVRWTGKTRKAWKIENATRARGYGYRLVNLTKEMAWLEKGTQAHGPKNKTFLYIPLTKAASKGWRPGLKPGKDYILRKWVRGIKAMKIVSKERKRAKARLKPSMREYISFVVKKFNK